MASLEFTELKINGIPNRIFCSNSIKEKRSWAANDQPSNQVRFQGSRQVLAWSMTGVLAHLNYVEQKRRQL